MSEPFLGEVRMFCGDFPPNQWALCDGRLMQIHQHADLFSLLGTSYGGDGVETFAVPNLIDRVPMHRGRGANLSSRAIGQIGGASCVVLSEAGMATHSHAASAFDGAGDQPSPSNAVWSASVAHDPSFGFASPDTEMAAGLLDPLGGGMPHENRAPFQAVNYIIALNGIYPQKP
jgi:microcystin-dependent protein